MPRKWHFTGSFRWYRVVFGSSSEPGETGHRYRYQQRVPDGSWASPPQNVIFDRLTRQAFLNVVNFDKQPVEFYGEAVADKTARSVRSLMESERCPFLDKRCVKQRKSDPTQTIGSCTVGYQGGPLIIC
ncbi:MAG: hypothetical protein H0U02_08950, partial [Rubrobacter sp.]|nr:hypothetical protein [Rubrobacter sp.]MBA3791184.1 hypothetical protein [Rubrobacter sp.]